MKRARREIVLGTIFGVSMLVVVCLFAASYVPRQSATSSPNPPVDFNKGWTTSDGATVDANKLFQQIKAPGEIIIISKQLPDTLYNDSYLNFNAKYTNFIVSVDGNIIYGFTGVDPTGQGMLESYIQHVKLDKSYANATITIQATPAYDDGASFFSDMAICGVDAYGFWFIQRYGLQFIVSIICIFLGMLQIVQYFAIPREFHTYDSLALGIGAICFGIWASIETQVPMLFVGSITTQLLMLDELCLLLLPYPVMRFFSSIVTRRSIVAENIVLAANIVIALAAAICLMMHVVDLHDMERFTIPLLAILAAAGLLAGIRSALLRKNVPESQRMSKTSLVAVLICAFCALGNFIFRLVYGVYGTDSAFLVRIGVAVMQIILLGEFVAMGGRNSRAAAESEAMRKLAYVDALTGVGNRAAFDIACDALEERRDEEGFDFLLVGFDVDDLKVVNDGYGHEAGDKHLIAASRILVAAFGNVADVFRIGGDEFDGLITGDDPLDKHNEALSKLRELEQRYNEEHPDIPLHISCGACLLSETESRTIREASSKADAAMYKDKISRKTS